MVSTDLRAVGSPFFRKTVTGPEASLQVMLKGVPATTFWKSAGVFVKIAALAAATSAAAKREVVNCILRMWYEEI